MEKTVSLEQEPKKSVKAGYIKEFKEEMKKISWTSKEELIRSTQIVVGSVFTIGLGIYVIDLSIRGLLDSLHIFVHKMVG